MILPRFPLSEIGEGVGGEVNLMRLPCAVTLGALTGHTTAGTLSV
jgi:hypothetical protein